MPFRKLRMYFEKHEAEEDMSEEEETISHECTNINHIHSWINGRINELTL
jgi:hypothetical protein